MFTNNPLADAITKEAIGEFGKPVFNEAFLEKHGSHISNVPRFYAAAFAVLENAVGYYVDAQLEIAQKPELRQAIRSAFATAAYGLSFEEIISLSDIVIAPFERDAIEKNFRRNGRRESIEVLMMYPERFGSHFQTIQDVRCAEFVGLLVGSPNENLETALLRSFSFWFFGNQAARSDQLSLADEISDHAEWAAALAVDKAARGILPIR